MIRRAAALVAVVLAVAGAVAAPGALAHEEVPGVKAVIDAIEPPLPAGVTVQTVISVTDQLIVENTTSTDLFVLGEAGEPFLRIGPQGTFANVKSPTWYLSNDPTGAAIPPASADAAAAPLFARVSKDPTWGWFDHRLHRTVLASAPAVASPDRPVRLEDWTVPMRYGELAVSIKGHREYAFPGGSFVASVGRSPEGVRAAALPGGTVPALALSRVGPSTITVLGEGGEPMARVSDAGLEVNEASPTWVFTAEAKGGASPDGPVGAAEAPRWRTLPGAPQLVWLERRAQGAAAGRERRWSVPVLVGDRRDAIEGVTRWVAAPRLPAARPAAHNSRQKLLVALLVAVGAGLGVVGLFVRRRMG